MSSTQDRRSFFSLLASLAGVAMVDSSVERVAAQAPARASGQWDMTWLDQFKGKHKQVFDYGTFDLGVDVRPLRFVRNYLDACRDVYSLEHPDVDTAVGISRAGFPINASDAIWQKYRIGERWKIQDPSTKQPAVRNIFLDGASGGADISVKGLQAKGTLFWQCNVALGGVAQELAQATQTPVQEVRAELIAGFNPGVRLVAAHVLGLGVVQERGFTYMKP